jgi:hypothetical protein
MNLQVIASPVGEILWVPGPLPGAVHDLNAARIWGIVRELAAAGLIVLTDKGYHGAGDHIRAPIQGKNKPLSQRPPTGVWAFNGCAARYNSMEAPARRMRIWRSLHLPGLHHLRIVVPTVIKSCPSAQDQDENVP